MTARRGPRARPRASAGRPSTPPPPRPWDSARASTPSHPGRPHGTVPRSARFPSLRTLLHVDPPPHPQTHSLKFGEIPESYGNHRWRMALYIRPTFSPGPLSLPLPLYFEAASLGRNPATYFPPLSLVFISLLFATLRGFFFFFFPSSLLVSLCSGEPERSKV